MNYEIWLDDPTGRHMILIDQVSGMRAVKVTGNAGAIVLTLPSIYDPYIKLDGIVEIWRKGEGGTLKLFNAYFIRKWVYSDEGGIPVTKITGVDGVHLLSRRIVAYAAGSANADITDYADDMAKTIVRAAATTAATDADRRWDALGFTVAVDESAAPSIAMAFSYRNILEVLYDITQASRENDTRLYFDVVPIPQDNGTLGWQFRTHTGQPGIDRTGADQIVFSPEWGNLKNASLTFDHADEVTVVYSGGQGMDEQRIVVEVEDVTRAGSSVWNRIEAFYNCSGQAETTAQVTAAGQAELSTLRPRLEFIGVLTDVPSVRFGVDWQFGDRVIVSYRGYQFDAVINAVELSLDGSGMETISGGFELL